MREVEKESSASVSVYRVIIYQWKIEIEINEAGSLIISW